MGTRTTAYILEQTDIDIDTSSTPSDAAAVSTRVLNKIKTFCCCDFNKFPATVSEREEYGGNKEKWDSALSKYNALTVNMYGGGQGKMDGES